ncbi:MAG: nitrilase-related carbon-nitrogen hydrolase, partial [Burkholderiaceae bacterium]
MTPSRQIVAVVQAAPVAGSLDQTLDKLDGLAGQAARQGAKLALFPEAFVGGYPRGMNFG